MNARYRIDAPAKINLWLRVLGRRPDGFHEVETLMVPVSGLADRLTFRPAADYSLRCSEPEVPVDDTNLVTRAVRLFQNETGRRCAYRIELEKRVPHGAGLGGGSSDAASALLALDTLENTGLGIERLAELGGILGSDVPFFVFRKGGVCRGRGERVEPVESPLAAKVVLLKPAFAVSTPDAYRRWSGARELPDVDYGPQPVDGVSLANDLERPVFEKFPFLAEVKLWLRAQEGVRAALMSGSGSTMFAILDDGVDGESLVRRARAELDPTLWGGVFRIETGMAG